MIATKAVVDYGRHVFQLKFTLKKAILNLFQPS
jgi:hypothetical protein